MALEVGSIFREAEVRETCVECSELTSSGCLRCGIPLCVEHAPADGRRCGECEREYLPHITRRDHELDLIKRSGAKRTLSAVSVIASMATILAVSAPPTLVAAAGAVGVWTIASVAGQERWIRFRERRARRRFLRQRKSLALGGGRTGERLALPAPQS